MDSLQNIARIATSRAVVLTGVMVACLLANDGFLRAQSGPGGKSDAEYIGSMIQVDMAEGTDDYFGEYSDLSYSDSVVPASKQPVVPVVVGPVEKNKSREPEPEVPVVDPPENP